jgi:putative ABC transport system permease protein
VKNASFADGFRATYQKPTEHVFVLAIENNDIWLTLVPEVFQILPKDFDALRKTRIGALMSVDIGKKYGWHIGDRISLLSNTLQKDGSGTWVFEIVGMFTNHESGQSSLLVTNYGYLDEARALNKGTVRNFYLAASDPLRAAAVADIIDQTFANSSNETKTASFRELAQQEIKSIGDLNFAVRSIVSTVLLALAFSIANMMMQSLRERTPELAVLKTLGFSNRAVFLIVVAEALSICVAAALMGLALAMGMFPYASKFVGGLSMPMVVIESGVVGAVLVALISVAIPARRAAKLHVADALAGR